MNYKTIFSSTQEQNWTNINWSKVERVLESLQHRITKAAECGDKKKVRRLQQHLVHSYAARLKAVRIVAQENAGSPGIDGEVWTIPERKLQAAQALRNRSKTKPLKRVYIPKSNGQRRGLGIPCMSDRASQALWNLALLPAVEAHSDLYSYGVRPYRGGWEANPEIRRV